MLKQSYDLYHIRNSVKNENENLFGIARKRKRNIQIKCQLPSSTELLQMMHD